MYKKSKVNTETEAPKVRDARGELSALRIKNIW